MDKKSKSVYLIVFPIPIVNMYHIIEITLIELGELDQVFKRPCLMLA